MKPLTFIATVLSLAFLGCASSPEERARSAIDTPEKWTVEDLDSTTTEAWLDDFNDPSLEALVDEALATGRQDEHVGSISTARRWESELRALG